MQGLLTNLLQKHWEWQENRREDLEPDKFKYKTMYIASLGVKTAFDVRSRGVRFAGRNAGRERVSMLRELRDGIPLL